MPFVPVQYAVGVGVEVLVDVVGGDKFVGVHSLGDSAQSDSLGVLLALAIDFPVRESIGAVVPIEVGAGKGGVDFGVKNLSGKQTRGVA